MMSKKLLYSLVSVILIAAIFTIAKVSKTPQQAQAIESRPELLIYCGITMIKPMAEIAQIIEKQEGCSIILTKGGSGNLLHSIKVNKVGDLYLPGSESYIKTCITEGIIDSPNTVHVGYNKAAMMVQKGNPKHIDNDLANLTKKQYRVVIGNPDSGSIGREARKILEKRGIFEQVRTNAIQLTTDSKKLVSVLRDDEADLVINWFATSTWSEHSPFVDVLPIDEQYASRKKLVLGMLNYSANPQIAAAFMNYARSAKGQAIFRKYGLYDVK